MSRGEPEQQTTPVLGVEDAEDALLEGDRTFAPGTARAALAYPAFRTVYFGSLLSNMGSWMQNVILGAFALELTGSSTYVSVLAFAQLGPLFMFSLPGGALADQFDRRRLLAVVSSTQLVLALGLAWISRGPDPSLVGLVVFTFLIGVGQAVYAPTYSALLPILVDKRDLSGAVSLNSASMNLSRVVGPAIGAVLFSRFGAPWVFAGNAVTYLFIILALRRVTLPPREPHPPDSKGWSRMVEGIAVARNDRVVGRCLLTLTTFSFFCLPFVVHIQRLAEDNLGIAPRSAAFGLFYACLGVGAVVGALSIGTFLAQRSLERIVRVGLVLFAASLAVLGTLRVPGPAYVTMLVVGFFYFATVTSLSTVLQTRLDDRVRGRVMALWVMAFGGTVAIGGLLAGPIVDATSVNVLVAVAVVVALLLVPYADLRDPAEVTDRRAVGGPVVPAVPPDSP